jgi:hypothetical protein
VLYGRYIRTFVDVLYFPFVHVHTAHTQRGPGRMSCDHTMWAGRAGFPPWTEYEAVAAPPHQAVAAWPVDARMHLDVFSLLTSHIVQDSAGNGCLAIASAEHPDIVRRQCNRRHDEHMSPPPRVFMNPHSRTVRDGGPDGTVRSAVSAVSPVLFYPMRMKPGTPWRVRSSSPFSFLDSPVARDAILPAVVQCRTATVLTSKCSTGTVLLPGRLDQGVISPRTHGLSPARLQCQGGHGTGVAAARRVIGPVERRVADGSGT